MTGAQGANTVALAAARHRVLARRAGTSRRAGCTGRRRVRVLAGEERHATIDRSLRLLGLGAHALEPVAAAATGRSRWMRWRARSKQATVTPRSSALQAGNVNTGACDDLAADLRARAPAQRLGTRGRRLRPVGGREPLEARTWCAASSRPTRGRSTAISGFKVPYDAGFVFCADAEAHAASMAYTAAYLVGQGAGTYVLESSRRARGFATWAALRELGRQGIAEVVDRCCALTERFAERLAALDGVEIGNEVVLNQALASFGSDERTDRLVAAAQHDGTFWAGPTTWHGRRYMRISISNWSTTEADVDRSVDATARLLAELPA